MLEGAAVVSVVVLVELVGLTDGGATVPVVFSVVPFAVVTVVVTTVVDGLVVEGEVAVEVWWVVDDSKAVQETLKQAWSST